MSPHLIFLREVRQVKGVTRRRISKGWIICKDLKYSVSLVFVSRYCPIGSVLISIEVYVIADTHILGVMLMKIRLHQSLQSYMSNVRVK